MLKDLLSNHVFMGSLGCLVLLGIGCLLYINSLYREVQQVSDRSDASVNPLEERTDDIGKKFPSQEAVFSETKNNNMGVQTGDSFRKLETELSQLSLKELIPHLEKMETPKLRKFVERNLQWLGPLVESEGSNLSSEEQVALEITLRRADPDYAKNYEEEYGYPPPPPGYTYGSEDGGARKLMKLNTPHISIKMKKRSEPSYGQWELLDDSEWKQYQRLNTIFQNNQALWDEWNIQVSTEVVELAEERRKPFYEKSYGYGTYHTYSVSSHYTRQQTAEDDVLKAQLIAEAVAECERLDTEKMQGRMEFFSDDREAVIALIRELEADLQRR